MDPMEQLQREISGIAASVRILSEIEDLPQILSDNAKLIEAFTGEEDPAVRFRAELLRKFGLAAVPLWQEARAFSTEAGWRKDASSG